jgi:hypothetical protein
MPAGIQPVLMSVLSLQAIASILPEDEDADMQDQHPWDNAAGAAAAAAAAGANASTAQPTDPNRQLSHMLLVAAAAASLPCIATTKCMQLPQHIQQQQSGWCGVSFSGLPGLHVQLHQQLLQLLRHAGGVLRVSWHNSKAHRAFPYCSRCSGGLCPESLGQPDNGRLSCIAAVAAG